MDKKEKITYEHKEVKREDKIIYRMHIYIQIVLVQTMTYSYFKLTQKIFCIMRYDDTSKIVNSA